MAKRLKIVNTTDMVAHLWAHQTQAEARNGHGNFYFNGDTIYSYGPHFPIARHVKTPDNREIVLFTTRGYSNTTSGHISTVRAALRDVHRIVYCFNPCAESKSEHAENFRHMAEGVEAIAASFTTSRLAKARVLANWQQAITDANTYAKLFKLKQRVKVVKVTKAMRDAVKISEEKRVAHEAAVEQRRAEKYARWKRDNEEAARLREEAEAQWQRDREAVWQAWLRGEGSTSALKDRRERPTMLRVIREGTERVHVGGVTECDLVETTLGAIVPLEDVRKAFVIWNLCVRKGQDWHRNGEQIKVGDFQLDSISATGNVIAGCHRIQRAEVERFATEQGWLQSPETDEEYCARKGL